MNETPHALSAPRLWITVVVFSLLITITIPVTQFQVSYLNWYMSIVWSVFALIAITDIRGMMHARKVIARESAVSGAKLSAKTTFVVLIVTKGDKQNVPSLQRVVDSFLNTLPNAFENWKIVVVTEGYQYPFEVGHPKDADCGIREVLAYENALRVRGYKNVFEVIVRPHDWELPGGTKFKARANQFALEWLDAQGLIRPDVWLVHMDDDTASGIDTAHGAAAFIQRQLNAMDRGKKPLLLAQGVLTYPRQHSTKLRLWLADAVRPGDDLARFAYFTGHKGNPRAGLHGELLLVRADIEFEFGWDFGPNTLTEDAQFSMAFRRKYPGRSGWFPARCYGTATAREMDFFKQRRRWAQGLLQIAFKRSIPLRDRWLLLATTMLWAVSICQNVIVMLGLAFLLGTGNTSPVAGVFLFMWCLGMAGTVTKYWEGLRANSHASGLRRPKLVWQIALVCLIVLQYFALIEAISGLWGLCRYLRQILTGHEHAFDVVLKTVKAATSSTPAAALESSQV